MVGGCARFHPVPISPADDARALETRTQRVSLTGHLQEQRASLLERRSAAGEALRFVRRESSS
jgi:hypothetical protein